MLHKSCIAYFHALSLQHENGDYLLLAPFKLIPLLLLLVLRLEIKNKNEY
jgi:hypothetical protein